MQRIYPNVPSELSALYPAGTILEFYSAPLNAGLVQDEYAVVGSQGKVKFYFIPAGTGWMPGATVKPLTVLGSTPITLPLYPAGRMQLATIAGVTENQLAVVSGAGEMRFTNHATHTAGFIARVFIVAPQWKLTGPARPVQPTFPWVWVGVAVAIVVVALVIAVVSYRRSKLTKPVASPQ